jgi:hypothetical protein
LDGSTDKLTVSAHLDGLEAGHGSCPIPTRLVGIWYDDQARSPLVEPIPACLGPALLRHEAIAAPNSVTILPIFATHLRFGVDFEQLGAADEIKGLR